MKLCEALLNERIDDNTIVIINDMWGATAICGRWYQDKILVWGNFDATFHFVEHRNIAIMQLL